MLFCTNQEHPFPHQVPSPQEDSAPLIFSVHGSSCLKHWIPVLNLNWCACVNKTSIILKGYFGAAVDNADDPERAFWVPRAGLHPMRGQLPGHTLLLSSQNCTAKIKLHFTPVHKTLPPLQCTGKLNFYIVRRVCWLECSGGKERGGGQDAVTSVPHNTHTHTAYNQHTDNTQHIYSTQTHTHRAQTHNLQRTIT